MVGIDYLTFRIRKEGFGGLSLGYNLDGCLKSKEWRKHWYRLGGKLALQYIKK